MSSNVVPMQSTSLQCVPDGCALPPWGPFPPPWFGPVQPPWYPGANAGVTFSLTAPINVIRGHFWWDGNALHMFDGVAWVFIGGSGAIDGGGGTGAGTVVISSTAPGNPVPGMQWWDGSQQRVWDGSSWKVVGPGAAAGPVPTTTIVFGLTAPTDFALGATPGSYSIIAFPAVPQVDTLLGWDPVTHKYKPTKAGIYQCGLRTWTGTQAGFSIAKNDPGTYSNLPTSDIVVAVGSSAAAGFMNINGMVVMNGTTDYVRCFGWNADAAFHNLGSNPVFTVTLLP